MDQNTLTRILSETAESILADAAFAIVDDSENPDTSTAGSQEARICFKVAYQGPFSGFLAACAPAGFARIAASNMLGIDEDDPEADSKSPDAVGELLNIIAGNLLPAISGPREEFKIFSPISVATEDFAALNSSCSTGTTLMVSLIVEGFLFKLFFCMDSSC